MAIAALTISAGVMAQAANQQQKTQVKPQTQTAQVKNENKSTNQPQVKEHHKTTVKTATAKADVKKQENKGKTGNSGEVKKGPEKK